MIHDHLEGAITEGLHLGPGELEGGGHSAKLVISPTTWHDQIDETGYHSPMQHTQFATPFS
jgi:hypothetical protein